ncbi:MAG: PIG-L family deacetylase [Chitinophagaceae bacterium]|nr:PIG-L family deacetylase [Chitinophagaceae bacterium]
MKKILLVLSLLIAANCIIAQEKSRIIVIGAHPDDCDSDAGGIAALLAEMGHAVKFVAVTNGDAGHHKIQGKALAERRYAETQEVAAYDVPALRKNPVFLYTRDNFQRPNPFRPDIAVDITSVYKKKISGLDAHVSQFYEWMPWIGHYEKEVPAGKEERFQWLMKRYEETIKPEFRTSLVKWYGEEKAKQVKYVEAFEICEYGAQPTEEDIRRLFPMLRK